jgi:hypothetical protein
MTYRGPYKTAYKSKKYNKNQMFTGTDGILLVKNNSHTYSFLKTQRSIFSTLAKGWGKRKEF